MSEPSSDGNAPSAAVQENPNPPAAAPSESMAGAVLVGGEQTSGDVPPAARDISPTELQENPNPPAAAPSESTVGAVLVGDETSSDVPQASDSAPTVLLENPHAQSAAPSESMEGSKLVAETPGTPAVAQAARPIAADLGRPVRTLPRRPRLRVTCSYDADDNMQMELTLMDERRELIHRLNVSPAPGSPMGKVFEALVSVAAQSAMQSGVFGAAPSPSSESE